MNTYRRLEIVFDIGNGPRVLAFVDFSSDLSFGILSITIIYDPPLTTDIDPPG
jgi:hypothetical protein